MTHGLKTHMTHDTWVEKKENQKIDKNNVVTGQASISIKICFLNFRPTPNPNKCSYVYIKVLETYLGDFKSL